MWGRPSIVHPRCTGRPTPPNIVAKLGRPRSSAIGLVVTFTSCVVEIMGRTKEELPLAAVFPKCSQGAPGSRPTGLNTATTASALPVRIMNQKPPASDTSTVPESTASGRTLVLCFDGTSEQYNGYASLLHSVLLHYS
jgi:hypothetical protein